MKDRLLTWLDETHGEFFELVRHFFRGLFDSELITAPDQLQKFVIGILAAIMSFTLYVPMSQFRKYVDLTTAHLVKEYHLHAMSDRRSLCCSQCCSWPSSLLSNGNRCSPRTATTATSCRCPFREARCFSPS